MSRRAQLQLRSQGFWFGRPDGFSLRLPETGSVLKGAGVVAATPGMVT